MKILRLLTGIAAAVSVLFCSISARAADLRPGDCNADGTVDFGDVEVMQEYLTARSDRISPAGDLNQDGCINAIDMTLLKRMLLQKTEKRCCWSICAALIWNLTMRKRLQIFWKCSVRSIQMI